MVSIRGREGANVFEKARGGKSRERSTNDEDDDDVDDDDDDESLGREPKRVVYELMEVKKSTVGRFTHRR